MSDRRCAEPVLLGLILDVAELRNDRVQRLFDFQHLRRGGLDDLLLHDLKIPEDLEEDLLHRLLYRLALDGNPGAPVHPAVPRALEDSRLAHLIDIVHRAPAKVTDNDLGEQRGRLVTPATGVRAPFERRLEVTPLVIRHDRLMGADRQAVRATDDLTLVHLHLAEDRSPHELPQRVRGPPLTLR
ncbi:hypothetical protein PV458_31395 [Streptomyces sp. MN03-5084-2B]|nr:hypothetical protein [Streptomyces sp. MN03-5084-2B]